MAESLTVQLSTNSQQVRASDGGDYNVLYEDKVQITYQQTYLGHVDVDPTQPERPYHPTYPEPPHPEPPHPEPHHPDRVFHAVPFQRAYHPTYFDHFYTTDAKEMENAISILGYKPEGIASYVFTTQAPNTIPLYRMHNVALVDHFYTTSYPEVQSAASGGYTYEGIAAYVYGSAIYGSVPFYRMYSQRVTDHFYTTSAAEVQSALTDYASEGIACYVLTHPT